MTKKKSWLYIHTLDGIPAQYTPGEQICFANGTRGNAGITRLARSVHQIKQEQKLSSAWRKAQGFLTFNQDYGYVRVRI